MLHCWHASKFEIVIRYRDRRIFFHKRTRTEFTPEEEACKMIELESCFNSYLFVYGRKDQGKIGKIFYSAPETLRTDGRIRRSCLPTRARIGRNLEKGPQEPLYAVDVALHS